MERGQIVEGLSFKDLLVLRILWELMVFKKTFPSAREILTELKNVRQELLAQGNFIKFGANSTSIVNSSLMRLEKAGFIARQKGKTRTIKLLVEESVFPPVFRISENFPL